MKAAGWLLAELKNVAAGLVYRGCGPVSPSSGASATKDTERGKEIIDHRAESGKIQNDHAPLGECRMRRFHATFARKQVQSLLYGIFLFKSWAHC